MRTKKYIAPEIEIMKFNREKIVLESGTGLGHESQGNAGTGDSAVWSAKPDLFA